MAHLFQTFKEDGTPHPLWRIEYRDWEGRKRKRTGFKSKSETERLARHIQAEQDAIKKGLRPPPKPSDIPRDFQEVVDSYLAWGKMQGGRGGRAWATEHYRKRDSQLSWWKKKLKLHRVSDLRGTLAAVEGALRELKNEKLSGKTIATYAETICTFCRWCVEREFLETNPLKKLGRIDGEPADRRRALTVEEIRRLLSVAPPERRLLYEVAFCSGLRRGELSKLTVGHLDTLRGGLRLDAEWTKNRKEGFQPLPHALFSALSEMSMKKSPTLPLLEVPTHAARSFDLDLAAAKIPKRIEGLGKIDFHACRVAYSTFVVEAGANVKEAQSLLRHSTAQLTMEVYARTRDERLSSIADAVGQMVLSGGQRSAPTAPQSDLESKTPNSTKHGPKESCTERDGESTATFDSPRLHQLNAQPQKYLRQKKTAECLSEVKAGQSQQLAGQARSEAGQKIEVTTSESGQTEPARGQVRPNAGPDSALNPPQWTGELEGRATPAESPRPADLELVARAWADLSEKVRLAIVAIVEATKAKRECKSGLE